MTDPSGMLTDAEALDRISGLLATWHRGTPARITREVERLVRATGRNAHPSRHLRPVPAPERLEQRKAQWAKDRHW